MDPQAAFWIAQGISFITAFAAIFALQLKSMRAILICQIAANLLSSSTYLLLGGISGAGVGLIAAVQAIIIFFLKQKKIEPRFWMSLVFIAMFVGYMLWSYKSPVDLLPMGAAVFYSLSISQKKPFLYRIYGTVNPTFWLVYDVFTLAIVSFLMHAGILISGIVGIIRLDILGRKKAKASEEVKE